MARFQISLLFAPAVLLCALPFAAAAQAPAGSPAPIVRTANGRPVYRGAPRLVSTSPVSGLHIVSDHALQPVPDAAAGATELRLTHGRATLRVNHPPANSLLLVDLPGGQVDLLDDGVYTLNAETGTLRVLSGKAQVFAPGADANAKGTAVHAGEEVVLADKMQPHAAAPEALRADLLQPQSPGGLRGEPGYGRPYAFYPAYTYAPYGYGRPWGPYYAPYAYPAYDYGWYGYPGFGWDIGFGWGGGYYGRGGWGRGFRR